MPLLAIERPERALFWTAPSSANHELATEDPLGFDYISQQIGLLLLPALTTRSTRAQAFAMVLYGLSLADRAVTHYGLAATDDERRRRFEPWERFWALATLEYKQGLPRGDWDTMRGIRGVKAVWRPTGDTLPLRFKMISRQQELGNLGAYLVPLRRAGLVADGTLRPTPAAEEIIAHFWDERRERDHVARYDDYALYALEPSRTTIARKHGTLSLAKVGERSRLLSLIEQGRKQQQERIDRALFKRRADPDTARIAQLVEDAARRKIHSTRAIIEEALSGALGSIDDALRERLRTALAFGEFMQQTLVAFDRVYQRIANDGWLVPFDRVHQRAFDPQLLASLRAAATALLASPRAHEIRALPQHGSAALALATTLSSADGPTALRSLLDYHGAVQRDRRRGAGWIRDDGDRLLLLVTSYRARPDELRFPAYKFDAVRTLLTDLGRLPKFETAMEVPT